jgi:hypothetical protein
MKPRARTYAYKLQTTIATALLLSSCATQPTVRAEEPPGLLLGLVHGFSAVFSLIGSFFWDIRIYAFPNSGRWYDVGFVIGTVIFFGLGGRETGRYYRAGYVEGFEAGKTQVEE